MTFTHHGNHDYYRLKVSILSSTKGMKKQAFPPTNIDNHLSYLLFLAPMRLRRRALGNGVRTAVSQSRHRSITGTITVPDFTATNHTAAYRYSATHSCKHKRRRPCCHSNYKKEALAHLRHLPDACSGRCDFLYLAFSFSDKHHSRYHAAKS